MYKLFTDGGSRGNPGNSSVAFFIFNESNGLVDFGSKFLGIATNNYAEYTALINGLSHAKKLGLESISCFLDSELVVKQLNGDYKISSSEIKSLAQKVIDLKKEFKTITFTHVPRSENKFADKLVNLILDTHEASQKE